MIPSGREVPRVYLGGLALVTLIGSALRLRAAFYPLRHDEAYAFLTYGLQPLWKTVSVYDCPANHMLHSVLLRFACLLWGDHEWAIRMPSLLAGMILIPAVFAVFARLADNASALLAAALAAGSQTLVAYSANARGYSQASLLALLMIAAAARLRDRRSLAAWAMLTTCAIASLYTIPSMLYAVAIVWIWLLLEAADQRQSEIRYADVLVSAIVVGVVTALLYLPLIVTSGWDALFSNQFVAPLAWPNFVSALPGSLATTWYDWHRSMPAVISWALALGFVVFVTGAAFGVRRRPSFALLLAAVIGIGAMLLLQRVAPPARVWLFLLPLFFGMAATGLCSLSELVSSAIRGLRQSGLSTPALAVLVMIAACAWLAMPLATGDALLADNEARDLPAIAAYLQPQLRSGDAVLAAPPLEEPLLYYFYRSGLPPTYVNAAPEHRGRCYLVLDSRYVPARNTAAGQILLEAPQARMVLLKKSNAGAVYEVERGERTQAEITHAATDVVPAPRQPRE